MAAALVPAVVVAGALLAPGQAGAADVGRAAAVTHTPLTKAVSGQPAALTVIGRSTRYAVVDDVSNGDIYLASPGGTGDAKVYLHDATADGLSGDLLTYRGTDKVRRWRLIDTTRTGVVPSTWAAVAPDGGMRVRTAGAATFLDYLHLDGTTQSIALPVNFPTDATYSIVASADGVAVAASKSGTTPKLAFSTLDTPATFTSLATTGLPAGLSLKCTSVTDTAVGCIAPNRVVRVTVGSSNPPQITTLMAAPKAVAVTDGYTSWTAPHTSSSTVCPCDLISLGADGSSLTAITGLGTAALAAGNGRFFYSYGAKHDTAGAYVTAFAGGGAARIAAAPSRPLTATAPALGAGRAAWVDDSDTGGPVRSAAVSAKAAVGTVRRIAAGASLVPVAVSGGRTAYTAPGGALRVVDGSVDSVIGHGTLLGLSGNRALVRATNGHLDVVDLLTGKSLDLTSRLGAKSAALWGGFVSYGRSDGSIWRASALGVHAVRLAAPRANTTATSVVAWGDWTAWTITTSGNSYSTSYRNAATLSTPRTVAHIDHVAVAGAAGLLVAAGTHFDLQAWSTGQTRTAIAPGTDAGGTAAGSTPSIDGDLYASLIDGRPTVSTLGVAVLNRPRSLSDASAPTSATRQSGWRLDLPTSAALTKCSVTISHGTAFHVTVPCTLAGAATGDVLAYWRPASKTAAPYSLYKWTVHASNADGSLLGANGRTATATGRFVLS